MIALPLLLAVLSAEPAEPGAPLPAQARGAQVTVPLAEYEALRKVQEAPSLTVIDTLRLSGVFAQKDLKVAVIGRAAGTRPAVPFVRGSSFRLFDCQGDGLVSRDGDAYVLTPLAPKFAVNCRVAAAGSDRLEMSTTPAVLWVASEVSDGVYVGSDQADGARSFSVVRTVVQGNGDELVKATATARYRITLQPDETAFSYQLEVRNPNRAHQAFDVSLVNGEHVTQVDTAAPYSVIAAQGKAPARYRFDLPPGETTLVLRGTLAPGSFAPPVEAQVQYLLLESHPLLRPEVTREAKRVSLNEIGLTAQFRGAQAFLLSAGEPLSWKVTRLEALRTTSFSVPQVQHTFFISSDGHALGESALTLDNQGASDLSLPMKAEPTFASLQGDPALLTKNSDGQLWLPLGPGKQELLVQHRQQLERYLGYARGEIWLPQLPVPATRAGVELRYPSEWVPLTESFGAETRTHGLETGDLFLGLVLLAWAERVLAALGLSRRRIAIAALVALGAWADEVFMGLLVTALSAATLAWLVVLARRLTWTIGRMVALVLIGGPLALAAIIGLAGTLTMKRSYEPASTEYAASRKAVDSLNNLPAQQAQLIAPAGSPAYQGLPARFEMPTGAARTSFSREMLATEAPRAVHVLLITRGLAAALRLGVVVLALAALGLAGRQLAAGARALWERLWAPPAEPKAAGA